jgi:hypothetical protein
LIFLIPAFAVAFPAFGVWTLLLSLLTFRAAPGEARPELSSWLHDSEAGFE